MIWKQKSALMTSSGIWKTHGKGMKNFVFILFFGMICFAGIPMGLAQESRQARFERIEAEKVAFITKELQLNTREAQRFFPVYNEYRKEITAVLQASRGNGDGRGRQRSNRIDELAVETELLTIKKKYRTQFSNIVGAARSSRFFEAEREFREKLVLELRRRGGGGGEGRMN